MHHSFSRFSLVTLACVPIACAGLLTGCTRQDADEAVDPATYGLAYDDPSMITAIKHARETTGTFIRVLNRPSDTQRSFAIKVDVSGGDFTEFAWITPVRYEDGVFAGPIGSLGGRDSDDSAVSVGEPRTVPSGEIIDWLYLDGEHLIGGYTIRAIRLSLDASERKRFDATLPFAMN